MLDPGTRKRDGPEDSEYGLRFSPEIESWSSWWADQKRRRRRLFCRAGRCRGPATEGCSAMRRRGGLGVTPEMPLKLLSLRGAQAAAARIRLCGFAYGL